MSNGDRQAGSHGQPSPEAATDPVTDRLSIDEGDLTLRIRQAGSRGRLIGKGRDAFLETNAARVRSWMEREARHRNDRLEALRLGPSLTPPPTVHPQPPAIASSVRKGIGPWPFHLSRHRFLRLGMSDDDRIAAAAYRHRRGRVLDEHHAALEPVAAPAEASLREAPSPEGPSPILNDLSGVLSAITAPDTPRFAVDAENPVRQGRLLRINIRMTAVERLPLYRLSVVWPERRLDREPVSNATVRLALRAWTLAAIAVCLDHLFLDRDDCTAVRIAVHGHTASGKSDRRLADAAFNKGEFLLEIGAGSTLQNLDPLPATVRLAEIPVEWIDRLRPDWAPAR